VIKRIEEIIESHILDGLDIHHHVRGIGTVPFEKNFKLIAVPVKMATTMGVSAGNSMRHFGFEQFTDNHEVPPVLSK